MRNTKEKKKGILNALLFVLIFGATLYGVFHGEDMGELKEALSRCRTGWIACAAGCVFAFLVFDALNMRLLLGSIGMPPPPGCCFLSTAVGFFFCAITPSASGGQPMQVYYLRKKGVPGSVTSVALLVTAIFYKLTLVLVGLGLLFAGHGYLQARLGGMMFFFHLGMILTAGWTAFLLLMLFRPGMAKGIVIWLMTVLEELHIMKNREKYQAAMDEVMESYAAASEHLKKHPRLMAEVFGIMILRRGALLSVTWCVYRALGLSGVSWPEIMMLQAVISICADMLPVPGGMGASEGLFLRVFGLAFGDVVLPGMLLSRGIGHYCQLILCAVFTLIAAATMNRGGRYVDI